MTQQMNELAGFLNEESRIRYQNKYPLIANQIESGKHAGGAPPAAEVEQQVKFTLDVTADLMKKCDSEIPKLRKKMRFSTNLKVAAQCLALVTSGTLTTLLGDKHLDVQRILAILTFLGSGISLIGDHLSLSLDPSTKLVNIYLKLVESQIELSIIQRDLDVWQISGFPEPSQINKVGEANTVTRTIRTQLALI